MLEGTIYGMGFETMAELDWVAGYPVAILVMGTGLKERDWL
ncbi:hypothetical protein [Streptomyces vinaceus]